MKKLLFTCAAGSFILLACKDQHEPASAWGEPDIIAVKTASIASLTVADIIQTSGLISTENEVSYSFKIGGVISRILVREGDFFKKGQLLALLNTTEISAGLAQAELAVEKAKRDYNRALNLYKDSVFTLEQLQNTTTALGLAQKSKDVTVFNEHYAKIYAASDGFVTKKVAGEGEVVGGGSPVLLTNSTEQNSSYVLKVGVTDREWAAIEPGQAATVVLDGYPGQKFPARVIKKRQAADREIGAFQVELKLELGKTTPAVGMFGKAEIATGQQQKNLSIPYNALVEADGDKAFVFTPAEGQKVKRVPVTISRFDRQQVYLKEGLEGIDKIVISNSAYLNEQSTIKIIQ